MNDGIRFNKQFWLVYVLAWIPYSLSYIAVFLTQSDLGILTLIFAMLRNIIPASILGLGVLLICNRISWSKHRKLWFFPLHLLFAVVYSLVWTGILFALLTYANYLRTGVWQIIAFLGNALQWQIFTGIMVYATIASISYVLQVVKNLREEERRAARAETLYAQNALAALQAQLNPHFIFNTLHSLMALIRYNPELAEEALEKLADMLRYSLKDKRGSAGYLVPLSEEMGFVDNYLNLEKLRLGDRLTVQKSIDSEAMDCLLPAFRIQPFVENAIKHGIAPKNIDAEVSITARKTNGRLLLEVADTGIGSSEQELEDSEGLGIKLVREQLQIQYGDRSSFDVSAKKDPGFAVTIEIPFTDSRENNDI